MSRYFKFWETFGANLFILDPFKNGYVASFVTSSPRIEIKNYKSTIKHEHFVDQSILDSTDSCCVQEVPFESCVMIQLSVATIKRSGKIRIILNLANLISLWRKEKSNSKIGMLCSLNFSPIKASF